MKHLIFKFFLLAGTTFALFSCSTSQTLTIEGRPSTEVLTPSLKTLGVIGNNHKLDIKISSDAYYAFLLTRSNGSKELVPFALDYRNKSYRGTQTQNLIGWALTISGLASAIPGTIMLVADSDNEAGGYVLAGGLGVVLLGAGIGIPASCRLQQTQYKYQYKYLSTQSTNEDFTFTRPTDNGFVRMVGGAPLRSEAQVEHTEEPPVATSTAARRRNKTSVARRNLRDYGRQVAGTYIGTGRLMLNGEEVESYTDIKVVLKRIDKNNVLVEVYESGEAFFNTGDKYSIKKSGNDKFALTLKGIPSATISISQDKNMVYLHPKVNIEGEIYTLEIKALLQE